MGGTRDEFAALRARWYPDAIFIHLHTDGGDPCDTGSRIVSVELAGLTRDGTVAHLTLPLARSEHSAQILGDLLTYLTTPDVRLITDDGESTPAWVAAKWPMVHLRWGGALRLLRLLRRDQPAVPPLVRPEEPGSMVDAALAVAVAEASALAREGQARIYQDAVQVSGALATQTVIGYAVSPACLSRTPAVPVGVDGRAHPRWVVLSDTGHPVIVARHPAMVSLPHSMRSCFEAPSPDHCWVRLSWPYSELRLWAVLSQDPLFACLVRDADPYAVIGRMLDELVPTDSVPPLTYSYLHGLNPADSAERALLAQRWRGVFPGLAHYRETVIETMRTGQPVFGWRGRHVPADRSREPLTYALRRVGQYAQATAMNEALVRLLGPDPRVRGISQVIPVFDQVAYCVERGQIETHLALAREQFSVELGLAGDGAPLALETAVEVGSTWGSLEKVPKGVSWQSV